MNIYFKPEDCTPENLAVRFAEISDLSGAAAHEQGGQQVMTFTSTAAAALGVNLG